MQPTFDPYHQWLGIPPAQQPPNYYRLLSIELMEDDIGVISHAVRGLLYRARKKMRDALGRSSLYLDRK